MFKRYDVAFSLSKNSGGRYRKDYHFISWWADFIRNESQSNIKLGTWDLDDLV